ARVPPGAIAGDDRRETVFRDGQPVPPAAIPLPGPAPAGSAADSRPAAGHPAGPGARDARAAGDAAEASREPGPVEDNATCAVCDNPLDPKLHALGDRTHP